MALTKRSSVRTGEEALVATLAKVRIEHRQMLILLISDQTLPICPIAMVTSDKLAMVCAG